jgi:hypothetical protein
VRVNVIIAASYTTLTIAPAPANNIVLRSPVAKPAIVSLSAVGGANPRTKIITTEPIRYGGYKLGERRIRATGKRNEQNRPLRYMMSVWHNPLNAKGIQPA